MVYGPLVVDRFCPEAIASSNEHDEIKRAWVSRDRSKIKSHPEFLAARGLMEAALACSTAIASLRFAVRLPWVYKKWLNSIRASRRMDATGGGRPRGQAWGSGNGGWGEGGWENGGWGQDPAWDGVTRVPKTPGKQRRRRQRLREWRAEQAARDAKWLEDSKLATLRWVADHPHLVSVPSPSPLELWHLNEL
ncbi:hypothetical protein C8R47DRAFT_1225739 [Mycena vitilis]|nr:hypothetical protein C8R47DRAFT_1225739 [Mycena vitilis]